MTRENAEVKGRRYLTEARLTVHHIDRDDVTASCRGDGTIYQLGYDHNRGGWYCDCPAQTDRCSHLTALRLVVIRQDRISA